MQAAYDLWAAQQHAKASPSESSLYGRFERDFGLRKPQKGTVMSDNAGHVIEEGSTNVYADLGFPDATAMLRKAQIVSEMSNTINARRWIQEAVAAVLQIDSSEVSRITRGQFRNISEVRLREWAARLNN